MYDDEQPTHHQEVKKDSSFLKFLLPFIAVGLGAILVFGLMILFLNMNNNNAALLNQQTSNQSSSSDQAAISQQPKQEVAVAPKTYDMSYTGSCYSPKDITIKKGDTVKFTNNGNRYMWPASNDHPSHTIYPEFDPKKSIAIGSSWSFTFDKVGTWGYHDHLKNSCTGTITVQ